MIAYRHRRTKPSTYDALKQWLAWRFGDRPEAPPEDADKAAQLAVEKRREGDEDAH